MKRLDARRRWGGSRGCTRWRFVAALAILDLQNIGDDALQAGFRVDPITTAPFRPESASRRARLLQGAGTPRLELVAGCLRAVSDRGDNDVNMVRPGIDGMKLSRFDRVLGLNRERIERVYRGKV